MWHPWRHLGEMPHIDLMWADLDGDLGYVEFEPPRITLATGMTQAERRSTLTHELIHHERGCCSADHETREEEAVNRLAAKRLIGIEQMGDALAWSRDPHEIAEELWVDVPTLQARLTHLHPAERAYLKRRLADPREPV